MAQTLILLRDLIHLVVTETVTRILMRAIDHLLSLEPMTLLQALKGKALERSNLNKVSATLNSNAY
jgi:hypothetical protein